MPLFTPSQSSFASHSFFAQRDFFHKGSSTLWTFSACSGMSVGKQTALIGATLNRVGLVTNLREKFQELVAPDAAFGFGAGTIIGVYIHPLTNDYYAIIDSNPPQASGEVARSTDGGLTWTDVTPPGAIAEGAQIIGISSSSTGRLWVHNAANAFAVNPDLFYSDDDGATWTDIISSQFETTHVPLDISPDGKTMIVLTGTDDFMLGTNLDAVAPTFTNLTTPVGSNGFLLQAGTPSSVTLTFRKNSLWNDDGTLYFGSADSGNYWWSDDNFLTFNEILIEDIISRPGSVNGTVQSVVVYSAIHKGFFQINRTNMTVAFFPEDDLRNSFSLMKSSLALNPIVTGMIDGKGDIAIPTSSGRVESPLINEF